jgi:hypothetical protein
MRSRAQISFLLHGWHSACALVCCSVAWLASLGAIVGGMILYATDGVNPLELFRYFTTIANTITVIGSGLLFPFTVEGFRRKHFSCPRWATMFFYSGTVCSTLTMLVATLVISRFDPVMAFGGYNLYLHVVCPLLTIVTFFLIESNSRYTTRDAALCITPVVIYAVVYLVEVVHVGSERGGWEDMYQVGTLLPPAAALALVTALAFGIAQLIRLAYGRVSDYRAARFERNQLKGDLTGVEVRLAVLELGEMNGRLEDENFVVLPLKGLSAVAERYSIRREKVVEVYARALIDTMDERRRAATTHDGDANSRTRGSMP